MIQPPLFKSVLEPVLDNLGELSVSRSTDRLTWDKPVPGDPLRTVSLVYYRYTLLLITYLTPHHQYSVFCIQHHPINYIMM